MIKRCSSYPKSTGKPSWVLLAMSTSLLNVLVYPQGLVRSWHTFVKRKRTRLDGEIDPELLDSGRRAREQRDHILQEIAALDQLPIAPEKTFDTNIPFSKAAVQLSDPAFCSELTFPFVGVVPTRFKVDHSTWEERSLQSSSKTLRWYRRVPSILLYGSMEPRAMGNLTF